MSVTFRILPKHGLVYASYEGQAYLKETSAALTDYLSHPDFRPGQKHLVDLSRVTGWDGDFVELMKIQARMADAMLGGGAEAMKVYYAPTRISLELARLALQSWDGLDGAVMLVQQSERRSLALLGLAERSFEQLLQDAD
ncbi:hypothetical protein G0A00_02315 [Yangia sp. PrR002]|nr:hypothetical protein [Salipiger sp. PrR002]NDW57097.1 hypothetical protein [Salipiger sp. PrR004]